MTHDVHLKEHPARAAFQAMHPPWCACGYCYVEPEHKVNCHRCAYLREHADELPQPVPIPTFSFAPAPAFSGIVDQRQHAWDLAETLPEPVATALCEHWPVERRRYHREKRLL